MMEDILNYAPYLRLSLEVLLVPLAFFSRDSLLRDKVWFSDVLTLFFVGLFLVTAVNYFYSMDFAKILSTFVWTPIMLVLVIVWFFAHAHSNGKE